MELIRQYPSVRVPRHFVMLGRVLLTLGGLMMHYQADVNLFQMFFAHLGKQKHVASTDEIPVFTEAGYESRAAAEA